MTWLGIAIRNLLRNGKSSASTVLILVVGVVALLLGSGFMLYTYDSLQEIAIRTHGHVILSNQEDTNLNQKDTLPLTISTWQDTADQLLAIPGVTRVLPRAHFVGLVSNGRLSASHTGIAVDPREEFRVHGPFLRTIRGRLLSHKRTADEIQEVIVGEDLAQTLHAQIGDVLKLHSLRHDNQLVTVKTQLVGTYRTGTEKNDAHSLMVRLNTADLLLTSRYSSQLSVYLNKQADTEWTSQYIQNHFPGFVVQTWQQHADLHDKVKALYDRIFGLMGIIIIGIVFVAITNTIGLAIYQRRQEIATLGALGTGRAKIYLMIVLEACLTGIASMLVGMLLAYGISRGINAIEVVMPAPPGKNEGYPLYIYASVYQYLGISAGLVAITALASIIAAFRHASVNIAEAMK